MDKYNIVSLGYICNVFSYLNTQKELKKNIKRGVFDRIATPMWAVKELVENDFKEFFLDENIKHEKLFDQSERKEWYDSRYYIRFLKTTQTERIRNILEKKTQDLTDLLNGNYDKPILFIRCQERHKLEDRGKRIILNEYKNKYAKAEQEYVKEFSQTLKTKYPNLKFKILFLSIDKNQSFDYENNIITISSSDSESNIENPRVLKKIIENNKDYIEKHL